MYRLSGSVLVLALALLPQTAFSNIVTDPAPPAGWVDAEHSAPLAGVEYSADGKLIYSLDNLGSLLIHDSKSGSLVQRVELRTENGKGVAPPLFRGVQSENLQAPRLALLPGGGFAVLRPNGTVDIFAKPTTGTAPKPAVSVPLPEVANPPAAEALPPGVTVLPRSVGAWAISPDQRMLVEVFYYAEYPVASARAPVNPPKRSAWIRTVSLPAGTELRKWETTQEAGFPLVSWSTDSKSLLMAMPQVGLQRLDPLSGELQSEWKPPAEAATAAEAAPPGRNMSNIPVGLGKTVGLSADGHYLLAATRGGLQLWNTADNTGKILENAARLPGADQAVFSADGTLVATRYGGGFWLWKTDGSQLGWARVPNANYSGLTIAPDATHVALADDGGSIRLWDAVAPLSKTPAQVFGGYYEPWKFMSGNGGPLLAATVRGVGKIDETGKLTWLPSAPIPSEAPMPPMMIQPRANIAGLTAAFDGKSWAESVTYDTYSMSMQGAGIARGELRVRDLTTGQMLWRRADPGPAETISLFDFLPDGTLLSGKRALGRSRTPVDTPLAGFQYWDGKTGEGKVPDVNWGDKVGLRAPGSVDVLEVSPSGKHYVVSGGSGSDGVKVIDVASKEILLTFGSNTELPYGPYAVSADGRWLAAIDKKSLRIWDTSAPKQPNGPSSRSLPLDQLATALRFGAGGQLAVGFADGRVLVWNPDFAADAKPTWETTPGRRITILEFSKDGTLLWTGDERGDLTTREAATGKLKSVLRLSAPATGSEAARWAMWTAKGEVVKGP